MHRRGKKLRVRIIAVILVFLLIATFVIDYRARPIIKQTAENKAERMATVALNDAITEEMQKLDADYNRLVDIEYAEDKSVKAIQTDIVALNILKANITNNASDRISSYTSDDISIYLGNLLNNDLFSGRGPKINIRLQMASNAMSNIESVFESAGINQTRHKINLHFTFSVYTIITGYNSAVDIDTTITIAETVIVGATPDNFTHIDGTPSDDDIDNLFNFRTQN